MSKFTSIIIKTFENLIKLNDVEIVIIYDTNNKLWFSLRDVFKALDYKDIKKEIKRLNIENKHLISYGKIYNELSNNTQYLKKHPQTVMIDEGGIYKLLDKSNKPIAKQFRDELFSDIIPELRDKGEFKFNQKDRNKLDNIKTKLKKTTHKLHLIKKEQQIHSKTKKQYNNLSGKGFIYILKVKTIQDGKEKQCHKIGYASNLNKRLATYKTGNPDVELVHQENVNCNKKQLEKCVLNLNILKRLSSKNEVICDSPLEEIKKEIEDCKKLITRYSSTKAKKI